jgi:glycosyltransferase involved in cell wall biosynthesis
MLRHSHGSHVLKIALSTLCENPRRKTGLTSLFHELVKHSVAQFEDIAWIVFAGPEQEWGLEHGRVRVVREFPANDRMRRRLMADHFLLPRRAKALGAEALVTVGFVPLRKTLPTVMHMLSLQHLDRSNRVGFLRKIYRTWMADRGFARADAILTNSQAARSQILAAHPQCGARLSVSHEGLQHERFHPNAEPGEAAALEREFGLQPGFLLWVSNFYPYKQADLLLGAYARLPEDARRRMPLVMIGGGWEGGAESAAGRARALGIAADVRFSGWVDDRWLAALYRQARIFVLPSREETFGRCVLEAMACGTPCVVNDIPIMHEVTAGHAVTVDFRDAAAVAESLARLAQDGGERDAMRAAGIRRAGDFSFERLARERIAVIRSVAERRARPV